MGKRIWVSYGLLCIVLAGCFPQEEPLAPGDALIQAQKRISQILDEEGTRWAGPRTPAPFDDRVSAEAVSFWFYQHPLMARLMARPELVEGFNASHPEGVLRPQFIGDWMVAVQKLTVSVAAGDVPDIALVTRDWMTRLAAAGRIEALDTFLPRELAQDLRGPSRQAFTFDGHLYGLPADGFCSALYLNRSLVEGPAPSTWEEWRACAEQVKRNVEYPIGHVPFLELLWSAGGDICEANRARLDAPPARAALDFILGLRDAALLHPRGIAEPASGFALFLSGQVAMTVASSRNAPRLKEVSFATAMAPVPGKLGPVSRQSDAALVVFRRRSRRRLPAVAAALDFLTGPRLQGVSAIELGSSPVRVSVAEAAKAPAGLDAAYRHSRNAPPIPVWAAIESELERCLHLAYRWRADAG